MKFGYLLAVIGLSLTLISCSDGGGGSASATKRGHFDATLDQDGQAVTKTQSIADSCANSTKMDSRLQPGLNIQSLSIEQDYMEIPTQQISTELIESINPNDNSYVKRVTLNAGATPGIALGTWLRLNCKFDFSQPNAASHNCDILNTSLGTLPAFDDENEVWTSCHISDYDDHVTLKPVVEDGKMTLANGKVVSAERKTLTYSGTVTCRTVKGNTEIDKKELGHGTVSEISVYSSEVPSTSSFCHSNITEVLRTRKLTLDSGQVLDLSDEEILGGNF